MQEEVLDKTVRINLLFDFYQSLLTEKQQTFLKCYFQDDYSLGEIAGEFDISRQAVYEHIKRAEHVLEEYEAKLQLVRKYEERREILDRLRALGERAAEPISREIVELAEQWERIEA